MDRKTVYFLKKNESDEFLKYEMRKPTFGEYKKNMKNICFYSIFIFFSIFILLSYFVHIIFIFFHKHINNHIFSTLSIS